MRKILTGDATKAAGYIGPARSLLAQCKRLGLPVMSRFGKDVRIEARVNPWGDQVWIHAGGGLFPHLLLTDGQTAHVYNYKLDQAKELRKIGEVPALGNLDLAPIYHGRCQQGEAGHLTYRGGWSAEKIEPEKFGVYLGGVNLYETAFFAAEGQLVAQVVDTRAEIATLPSSPMLELSGAQGREYFATVISPTTTNPHDNWNLAAGVEALFVRPDDGSTFAGWTWVPNFYRALPKNPFFARTGWYYGPQYGTPYDPAVDLRDAEVVFKGMLDCRSLNGTWNKHGYAEMVTRTQTVTEEEPTEHADLFVYTQAGRLYSPLAESEFYQSDQVFQNQLNAMIHMGDVGLGKDYTFRMKLPLKFQSADVQMWSHDCWYDPLEFMSDSTRDGIGLAVFDGQKAQFWRHYAFLSLDGGYMGGEEKIYETETYHSHAVSRNGELLAVFEGQTFIERVRIFDLYGEKKEEGDEEAAKEAGNDALLKALQAVEIGEYYKTGFMEIQSSDVIAKSEGEIGVWVPHRGKDIETKPAAKTWSPGYSDPKPYAPSLASAYFNNRAAEGMGVRFYKVTIEGGTVATFSQHLDECFDSEFVLDIENNDTDYFFGRTAQWGKYEAEHYDASSILVRGYFTGSEDSMRFQGIGEPWKTITGPSTFSIVAVGFGGGWEFEGYHGELASISGFRKSGVSYYTDKEAARFDCNEGDYGAYVLEATSTCGQTATAYDEVDPLAWASVPWWGPPEVGDKYSAGGGKPEITHSLSCGSINPETGKITSLSGCCEDEEVTATDECGRLITYPLHEPEPLGLTGSDVYEEGSSYYGTGGRPPYSYSSSAGNIDPDTGYVPETSGDCGTGTVTVTDDCGTTAIMEVRFPDGQWVETSYDRYYGSFVACDADGDRCYVTTTSGGERVVTQWQGYVNDFGANCCEHFDGCPSLTCDEDNSSASCFTRENYDCVAIASRTDYEWQCV